MTSGYLSWRGRLRMMAEVAVPPERTATEESVAEFCGRRFGTEFVQRVMDPLVGGMFAGDVARLAVAAVFPTLVAMEHRHGSVIRGLVRARLRGGRMPARRLFSWHAGIGALPRTLAIRLGPLVKTGTAVRRITARPQGFRIEVCRSGAIDASAVVIATQPHVASELLVRIDETAADATAAIEAPPIAVIFLGYHRGRLAHPSMA